MDSNGLFDAAELQTAFRKLGSMTQSQAWDAAYLVIGLQQGRNLDDVIRKIQLENEEEE